MTRRAAGIGSFSGARSSPQSDRIGCADATPSRPARPERAGRGRRWGTILVAASVAAALVAAVLVGVSMSRKPTDISGVPGPTNSAVAPSTSLPKSAPLGPDQFVVPWGPNEQLQLYVASVTAASSRAGLPVRPTIDCTERHCRLIDAA